MMPRSRTTLLVVFLCISRIAEAFTSRHSQIITHRGGRSSITPETTSCCCLFANNEDNSCSRRRFVQIITSSTVSCFLLDSSPSFAVGDNAYNSSHQTNTNRNTNDDPIINNQKKSPTIQTSDTTTPLQESISGFLSGTAVSAVKTIVKYPLDTATVRLQMPSTIYTIRNLPQLFAGSYDGIVGPLLSNIPAGAVFFAVKDVVKSTMKENTSVLLPKWVSTSIAVAAALPPYWLIRNPSEVIKTRIQVGCDGYEGKNMMEAFQYSLMNDNGDEKSSKKIASLYQGYTENILYGFPADIVKFVTYDNLSGGKKDLSPIVGAWYGAISTGIAQCVTTPLDVARNRIMAEVKDNNTTDNIDNVDGSKMNYMERLVKIAKEEGVEALFAGTTPRIAKAMLSGALQFAAYEETKQKVNEMFLRR